MKEHRGVVMAGDVKVAECTIFIREGDIPAFKKFLEWLDVRRGMDVSFQPVDEADKPFAIGG